MSFFENFLHTFEIDTGQLYLGYRLSGDNTQFCPGFTDGNLYLKPFIELILV